jgi:hypothetical protein
MCSSQLSDRQHVRAFCLHIFFWPTAFPYLYSMASYRFHSHSSPNRNSSWGLQNQQMHPPQQAR